jgi:DNA-binding MarR family transcriptional regulator
MPSAFFDLFSHISRATKEATEQKLRKCGLHAGQQFILELLWTSQEDLTVGEIATRLDVEDPTITRTVQRMARQGLLEKRPHPTDARQVIVQLTPRGRELQGCVPQAVAELEAQLLTDISEVERALLMRVFKQMLHNLEDSRTLP